MKLLRKALKLFCTFAAASAVLTFFAGAAEFKDVGNHWAKTYIDYGVEKGYIKGYDYGTFKPNAKVTRAEFSKMINNAVGITASKQIDFTDVSSGTWYYQEIAKAVYAGYVSGYSDNSFLPNNYISRQEAAVILSRISVPADKKNNISTFSDAESIAVWAKDAVGAISAKGYISGDEYSRFLPTDSLTRAQAAKLIYEFVENENIRTGDFNITNGSSTFSETLFTDSVVCANSLNASKLTFENCRVLGKLDVKGNDVNIEISSSDISSVTADSEGAEITLDSLSSVKNVEILKPVDLRGSGFGSINLSGEELYAGSVAIIGDCDTVYVNESAIIKASLGQIKNMNVTEKVNLVIQSGSIENLVVDAAAAGSTITLSQNTTVLNATVNAAVSFLGLGQIDSAYNAVTGITYETKPGTVSGKSSTDKNNESLSVTVTPANGKTGVSELSTVILKFDDKVYDDSGEELTSTYLKNHIKIRKGSKTGTSITFTTVVSTAGNTITLTPSSYLVEDQTYYVVIDEDTFYDEDGKTNKEISSYFKVGSTDSDATITFSPKSGATGVDQDTEIKITFSSSITRANGSTVTAAYLQSGVIELRKGSSTGVKVDFTASISSSRIITIKPEENLVPNTKYYVIILANSFAEKDGDIISKKTAYFTTSNSLIPEITPSNASTGISTLPEITIEFGEAVTRITGTSVTSAYLMGGVLELRKSSSTGTEISFSATISSDKKTITLIPDEELAKNTKYYVIINDGTLKGSSGGAVNEKTTSYFTTAASMAPIVTPSAGNKNVSTATDITITFSDPLYTSSSASKRVLITPEYIEKNEAVLLRRSSTSGAKIACDISVSSDCRTITLSPKSELLADFKYYIVVKSKCFYNESGKYNSASSTYFSTTETLTPEFTPVDGEEDVDVNVKPEIIFNEAVYRPNLSALTTSYIMSNVIEFHKGDENGELVDFTVTLDSTKQIITIKPDDELEGNTDYCIVVVAGSLVNGNEIANPKAVATFTTENSVNTEVKFEPANKDTGISLLTDVTISFASKIYRYGGGTVTKTYAEQYIELRRSSASGTVVDTELSVSSDGKTVTLTPVEPLAANTTYYVKILANKFQYIDDTKVAAKSIYFKTGSGNPTLSKFTVGSVGAASASFGVESDTSGTLYVTATPTSGSAVTDSYNITAGTSKTVVLSGLSPKTSYTVKAYVESELGAKSAVVTQSILTGNAFEMTVEKVTDTSVAICAKAYTDGKLTVTYKNSDTGAVMTKTTNIIMSEDSEKNITISELEPGTQYEIIAKFVCDGSEEAPVVVSKNILTDEAEDYLAVSMIHISDKEGNEYEADVDGYDAKAVIGKTDSVKIKVEVPGSASSVKIDGKTVENGEYSQSIAVTEAEKIVPIVVSYNGSSVTYTLEITVN